MTEIVHRHTERPYYQTESGDLTNRWADNPDRLNHTVSRREHGQKSPVVFDIETTAETPQRPILVTAYDSMEQVVEIAFDYGRDGFRPKDSDVKELVIEGFDDVPVKDVIVSRNVSQAWFERRVLSRVLNEPSKVLTGHNIGFDLGLLASPNWAVVDVLGEDKSDWDGAMTFKDISCLFKRAGAFGKLYSFIDTSSDGGYLSANVADTQTVAKSLWLPAGLSDLSDHFGIGGIEADEHGKLGADYIKYNADDVRQTYQCHERLTVELANGFDTDMTPDTVYSTASLAKDVLTRMGYDRTHYTEQAATVIPEAYFGGRTEALVTGELVSDVTYMDILSQYPTVCGLTQVWDCMRAEQIDIQHIDSEALPKPSADDLRQSEIWPTIAPYYVKVSADGAVLPVRTDAMGDTTRVYTADVQHTGSESTWYHYMDVLAAELMGEAEYDIQSAVKVVPEGTQDLQDVTVGGREIQSDDNVMVRCIEERKSVQAENGGENRRTKSLKITANSCYGIAAERIVTENGQDRHDTAGKFYNPHVAATITAGGRLQLAIGEHAAEQSGGSLYYCDTDSLIVDESVSTAVQQAYSGLNPYEAEPVCNAEVLEIEDGKLADGTGVLCSGGELFAIGVKKYCYMKDSEPVKFTEHGLGHYSNMRDSDTVRGFWKYLLSQKFGLYVDGDMLPIEKLSEPVIWQQGASTEAVRAMVDEHLTDEFRYGDWVERLIMLEQDGTDRFYFGVDVTDRCLRIEVQPDGSISHEVLTGDNLANREQFKTVQDVVMDWFMDGDTGTNGRYSVSITGHKPVTKEATTVKLAWDELVISAAKQVVAGFLFSD